MRAGKKITVSCTPALKSKLLRWAQQFHEVVWLDSNAYPDPYKSYQAVLAVDAFTAISTDSYNAFAKLHEYQSQSNDWLFGYLTYDLKNDIEVLASENIDGLDFPELYFFQPKKVFLLTENEVEFRYLKLVEDEMEADWKAIQGQGGTMQTEKETNRSPVKISVRTSRDSYFEKVGQLLRHIERGDIYEANFCQEFYSEEAAIDPLQTFFHLNEISKAPFAAFLKLDAHYAISASPERYLKKTGNKLVSQPIKGTARRLENKHEDAQMRKKLENDPKERSENIMITDLVRNDLSRVAAKGSVTVEELCKGYTFQQVHQLISTVSCIVKPGASTVDLLKNTFPMGSMTGVPKISAMQLIEAVEDAKRGLYSGSIGYFTPEGDFDFNVMIRTILYNRKRKYVSFSVGGAITIRSEPENEYQECLLKAKAMREVLE